MRNALPGLLLILLSIAPAHAAVESGLWYDRLHSGHGLDLHRQGGVLFGAFYTYDANNAVEWLWLQTADVAAPTSPLTRYRRAAGAVAGSSAGSISLTPVTACPDGIARTDARTLLRMDFTLDGREQTWCVEPLLPATPEPLAVLSGAWYSPADPGWGVMSHAFAGADGAAWLYRTMYFHDAAGNPRWAFAQDRAAGLGQSQLYYTPVVECFGCPAISLLPAPIGSATLTLTQPLPATDASRNRVALSLRFQDGAPFARDTALALLSAPARVPGAVATREGPAAGRVLDDGVEKFMNLPFAEAPIGALRWRAPQAPRVRTALRDARATGPGCVQPPGQGAFSSAPAVQNEDCLQLNVWRPASPGPHPVMVWIHGGGLTQGSAVQELNGVPIYDGAAFARLGVVFVSVNYRLGPFGYLAQRDFVGEAADQPQAGNYGLLDQIASLAWVRDNIAAFAGDPARVTIFGESAGGVSTCALLASPLARGLFARVIVQSGNCLQNVPTLATAFAQGDRITAAAGCTNAGDRRACLRNIDAATLLAVAQPVVDPANVSNVGEEFGLVVDGVALSEPPGRALTAARGAALPLMIGVNDDETTTLVPATSLPATVAGYEAAISTRFPPIAGAVLQRYPAAAYATPQAAYQDLLDDLLFTCAARRAAADHATAGNIVYHYALSAILPDLAQLQSFHGADIVLLFGPRTQALPDERALSTLMRRAWADFASGREPGNTDGVPWPRYDAATRRSLEFTGPGARVIDDYRRDYCQFWSAFATL